MKKLFGVAAAAAMAATAAMIPAASEAVTIVVNMKGPGAGVTYIGTDNQVGAALAASHICENVDEGADVAILQGIITQSTGKARADGANAGLSECGLNIVAEQTGEWDRAKGLAVMENIITGNPNLKAVFASNDNMGLGAFGVESVVTLIGGGTIPPVIDTGTVLVTKENAADFQ